MEIECASKVETRGKVSGSESAKLSRNRNCKQSSVYNSRLGPTEIGQEARQSTHNQDAWIIF